MATGINEMENQRVTKQEAMQCGESIVDYYAMHYPSYARLVSSPEKLKNLEVEFAKSCYENNINLELCMKALKLGVDSREMVPQGRKPFLDDVAAVRAEERRKHQQDELIQKRQIPKVTDSPIANVLHNAARNPRGKEWMAAIKKSLTTGKINSTQIAKDVGMPESQMRHNLRVLGADTGEI